MSEKQEMHAKIETFGADISGQQSSKQQPQDVLLLWWLSLWCECRAPGG